MKKYFLIVVFVVITTSVQSSESLVHRGAFWWTMTNKLFPDVYKALQGKRTVEQRGCASLSLATSLSTRRPLDEATVAALQSSSSCGSPPCSSRASTVLPNSSRA